MTRKPSQRLQTLLKLADLREQQAAKALAAQAERLQQAEQQQRALVQYEREYQQSFVERSQGTAFSGRDLLNYQGFFHQLESAQQTQARTVQLRDHAREQARLRWLELNAKRRLLEQLRERRLRREEAEQDRKLQRDIDDRSARAASARRDPD